MIGSYVEEVVKYGECDDARGLKPGVMWVIKDGERVKAVNFLCPCGCGSECYTPVYPKGEPKPHDRCWEYSQGPTLHPSIRYTGGCKAHFNITNGKTIIHEDSGK